jgi:hypothetical protein
MPALDQQILFHSEPFATWFGIRKELEPTLRVSDKGSLLTSSHSSFLGGSSSQTLTTPSNRSSSQRSSVSSGSPLSSNQDDDLNRSVPVLNHSIPVIVMAWIKVNVPVFFYFHINLNAISRTTPLPSKSLSIPEQIIAFNCWITNLHWAHKALRPANFLKPIWKNGRNG